MIMNMTMRVIAFYVMAFAIILSSATASTVDLSRKLLEPSFDMESLRGINYPRGLMTCDRFPRVCRAKGSPGPDCCRKNCVNVTVDNLNCGECGRRCRFGEMCCGGSCVNVLYDPKNCGGCKKRCKKGSYCSYGMCSYA